jgi:hypothetical protein
MQQHLSEFGPVSGQHRILQYITMSLNSMKYLECDFLPCGDTYIIVNMYDNLYATMPTILISKERDLKICVLFSPNNCRTN